ncbi:MAG TPA: glycosyltransferase [Candidatus Saccharimonadales bacterium]|nr:glycosyltransferase [Candidatus Saccharimonadales bacterium]
MSEIDDQSSARVVAGLLVGLSGSLLGRDSLAVIDGCSGSATLSGSLAALGVEVLDPAAVDRGRDKRADEAPAQPRRIALVVDTSGVEQDLGRASIQLASLIESDSAPAFVALVGWNVGTSSAWADLAIAGWSTSAREILRQRFQAPEFVEWSSSRRAGSGKVDDGGVTRGGLALWREAAAPSLAAGAPAHLVDGAPPSPRALQSRVDAQVGAGELATLVEEAAMLRDELDRELYRMARRARDLAARVPYGLPVAHRLFQGARAVKRVTARRGPHHASVPLDPVGTTYPLRDQWLDFEHPQVSVVILNFNRGDLTLASLQHVWRNTAGARYEVIVADNGSTPGDLKAARRHRLHFRELRIGVNRYFGEGNNIAAEECRGELIFFLNNDAMPAAGWLEPILAALDDPSVGAAGSRLLFPDGRIQETGAMISPDGTPVQLEKGWPIEQGATEEVRTVDYCSAAALGVRKELFIRVGGFDLIWEPAYYEDVDLCLKIRREGFRVVCATTSHVVHLEHATTAHRIAGLDLVGQPEFNKSRFVERWGAALRADPGEVSPVSGIRVVEPDWDRPPATRGLRLGLYTPYQLVPGGGERYLLMLAAALADPASTTFVFPHPYSAVRLRQLAGELRIPLGDGFRTTTYAAAKQELPFDVFITMSNELFPPVEALGHQNFYVCQFPFPAPHAVLKERSGFNSGYQSVLVYSQFAAQAYRAALARFGAPPQDPVVLYPPCGPLPPPVERRSGDARLRILSVGRFFQGGHEKRHDVMIKALGELVSATGQADRYELHLVGTAMHKWGSRAYLSRLERLARDLPVQFHVNASAQDLQHLLDDCDVYWHAAGFGVSAQHHPERLEHFGIAIVEAMAHGCIPFAYGAGGPAEIISSGVDGYLYQSAEELITVTRELGRLAASDPAQLTSLRAAGRIRAAEFTDREFAGRVAALLGRPTGSP